RRRHRRIVSTASNSNNGSSIRTNSSSADLRSRIPMRFRTASVSRTTAETPIWRRCAVRSRRHLVDMDSSSAKTLRRTHALIPPVRTLAEQLGVNRNTAVAAYRRLARDGAVVAQGRAGTRIAGRQPTAQEGFAPAAALAVPAARDGADGDRPDGGSADGDRR